jgi:hypothetical protein
MKTLIILILMITLVGCGTPTPMNVVMTNPQTGKKVYISHNSWGFGMAGLTAAIAAHESQRKAIEAAKMIGYTEMEEVR